MWPALIVVDASRFDHGLGVSQRFELMDVQVFVSEPPVERFDERVCDGFARPNEVELYAAAIGPIFEGTRLKLGVVSRVFRTFRSVEPRSEHLRS